jgi:glycosyltransferase involved in cell wall biosynthesis
MKVLIATGIYPPDIGGPAIYSVNLARELELLNCKVSIVAYGKKKIQSYNNNVCIVDKEQNILKSYLNFFSSVRRQSKSVDIVYVLDLISSGLPATLAAKLNKKKVVFRTGGDFLWEKAYQKGWTTATLKEYYNKKKNFLENLLIIFCTTFLKLFDLVIFSTELQKNIYKDRYKISEKKSLIIANPLPFIKLPTSSDKKENKIIFAGRLIKLKNIERLVMAFGKIKNLENKLIIYGDGPEKENIKNVIKCNNFSNMEVRNGIDQEHLFKEIKTAKFFILPSITEISPNIILECISIGVPVLLTKENGLSRKISSEIITIDPNSEDSIKEKIEFLLKKENLIAYTEKIKSIYFEKKEWKDVANEHLTIFKRLIYEKDSIN